MQVYTTLVYFASSTWGLDIRGVLWLSIKPVYGYVKNENAQIQKLEGFIPLTKLEVVRCLILMYMDLLHLGVLLTIIQSHHSSWSIIDYILGCFYCRNIFLNKTKTDFVHICVLQI